MRTLEGMKQKWIYWLNLKINSNSFYSFAAILIWEEHEKQK